MKIRLINYIAVALIISGLVFFVLYQADLVTNESLNLSLREKKTAAESDSTVEIVMSEESDRPAMTTGEDETSSEEETSLSDKESSEDVFAALRQPRQQQPTSPLYELFLENDDLVGWLTIPETRIDYPVVRAADNDYYLDHDFYSQPSKAGSIFMDYRNIGDGSDLHSIIYGHKMKNKTMFYDLLRFRDTKFYSATRILTFETLREPLHYKVFAAYTTGPDFYFITTRFNEVTHAQFIREIRSRTDHEWDTEVNFSDRILTLVTCSHDFKDSRYVVHAVLIDELPGIN